MGKPENPGAKEIGLTNAIESLLKNNNKEFQIYLIYVLYTDYQTSD